MEVFLLGAVILLAGGFAFINGFHDVSNSIATSIRTRALTPTVAVLLAALFNFVGALMSVALARLFTGDSIDLPAGQGGLGILISALLAACLWGLFTWYRGMPSSSTHALIGALIGAGGAATILGSESIAGPGGVLFPEIVLPLLVSPVVAFLLAYLAVFPATWFLRHSSPRKVNNGNRMAQAVLAGSFAFSHGLQDGQRTTAVILLALAGSGVYAGNVVPVWVQLFAAVLLAGGSLLGGWRITHTLAHRLVRIDPLHGMTAQGVSAVMLFVGAMVLHMPLSSTHTMTSAIVGAGANHRYATVRKSQVRSVLLVWITTAPVTSVLAAVLYLAISPLL
ncbi:inorganic phosphate transporter [Arthrobacter sp. JZ12]|uniref:inorganic phosphate transporter n=1 Tax=Arthrobacter sp. JZ12 TaxID=2654190 RepID=UPI002B48AEF7|nr:anion permease [Arthrobacter sp. JZ12]WRH23769.1 inorganic phosphate transporter [Arthrobacter sp. JZ12]